MANSFRLSVASVLTIVILLTGIISCSKKTITTTGRYLKDQLFWSEYYNHFEEGVLFTDIEQGLSVLWKASFKNGQVYKENLGLIVSGGVLILPNKNNTANSSRFSVSLFVKENKLYVECRDITFQVMGIVHTHPDGLSFIEPTSKKDYQFAYLGIHNYIISNNLLFDAYYNERGNETFERIRKTHNYQGIPQTETANYRYAKH